ncbi:hypothetical protein OF83DRAFT_1160602 [Amylostereum chailletii]|nr:hypothetical protein OF83DRAFT_1160602 [Amylostereum chailletii]
MFEDPFTHQSWLSLSDDDYDVDDSIFNYICAEDFQWPFDDTLTLEDAFEEVLIDDNKTRELLESLGLMLPGVSDLLDTLHYSSSEASSDASDENISESNASSNRTSSDSSGDLAALFNAMGGAATGSTSNPYCLLYNRGWSSTIDHRNLVLPWMSEQGGKSLAHLQEVYDGLSIKWNDPELDRMMPFEISTPSPLPQDLPQNAMANALGLLQDGDAMLWWPTHEENDLPEVCHLYDLTISDFDLPVADETGYEGYAGATPAWFSVEVARIREVHL